MKKKLHRLLALLMTAMMLLGSFPMEALAAVPSPEFSPYQVYQLSEEETVVFNTTPQKLLTSYIKTVEDTVTGDYSTTGSAKKS